MKSIYYGLVNFRPSERVDPRWFDIRVFRVDPLLDDEELISCLVGGEWYGDAYWSRWDGNPAPGNPLHGPYMKSSISEKNFKKISKKDALSKLNNWIFSLGSLEDELIDKIGLYVLPRFSDEMNIYHLETNDLELDTPIIFTRDSGFHEFLIIDRNRSELTLLVATDD